MKYMCRLGTVSKNILLEGLKWFHGASLTFSSDVEINNKYQIPNLQFFYCTVISKNDTCEAKFCSTREGNMRKIKSYNFTKAEPYLQYLIPKKNLKRIWTNRNISNIELPVIVTGASSNHYKEALKLLHNLKTVVFPVYKTDLVFFDLGLNQAQRKKVTLEFVCRL